MDWQEKLEQFKIPIALSLIGVVLIIGGLFVSNNKSTSSAPKSTSFPKESLVKPSSLASISVDVSGAVNGPGVYQFNSGQRIEDAVAAAGGFAAKVNSEYVSKDLNLAQKLSDGMKIYVPFEGETGLVTSVSQAGAVAGASVVAGQVNINSASQSDLEALPGIGPVTAAKIIAGRPYQKVEDLQTQKVISASVFAKIKDLIVAN